MQAANVARSSSPPDAARDRRTRLATARREACRRPDAPRWRAGARPFPSAADHDTPRPMAITYRQAGADIDAGGALVGRIARLARPTRIPEVIAGVGGFAGLWGLPAGLTEPVLVSGTDGVG